MQKLLKSVDFFQRYKEVKLWTFFATQYVAVESSAMQLIGSSLAPHGEVLRIFERQFIGRRADQSCCPCDHSVWDRTTL